MTRRSGRHRTLDERLGDACAWWVDAVLRRPGAVVAVFALATAAAVGVTLTSLRLDTNENDLFSKDLPFIALRQRYYRAFPQLADPIVVVVDGATVDQSEEAADALARRLQGDSRVRGVQLPMGGPFFERNGLLYLGTDELQDLVDNLFEVQPFLAKLSRDPTLRGLLEMLAEAARATADGHFAAGELEKVLDRVSDCLDAQLAGRPAALSWSEVIAGRKMSRRDRRRFVLVEPIVDFSAAAPAEGSLLAVHEAARAVLAELGGDASGLLMRATGVFPLSYEEMDHVRNQVAGAGLASFVIVGLLLLPGLGSGRLVVCSLATLVLGLVLTAGFAALAIGHLNLISVSFAVLFIGLSIDYAIHLAVRFRELAAGGAPCREALVEAARSVGGSLVLCATTTIIGFFAFVGTDYVGVAELGVITGTGVGISLVCNLTLLPVLIARFVHPADLRPPRPLPGVVQRLLAVPVAHARGVLVATGLLTVAAGFVAPRIAFDPNPLRVRDPTTPSVRAMNEMLADGDAMLWNLNALAPDLAAAKRLAARLDELPEVDFTVTLADFVPSDEATKREILADAAFVLLPTFAVPRDEGVLAAAPLRGAVRDLSGALRRLADAGVAPALAKAATRTLASLGQLTARADDPALRERLHRALVGTLAKRLEVLRASLEPEQVTLDDLPEQLVRSMRAPDGRMRVEVYPVADLNDMQALEGYVRSVQKVAPEAFGEGLVILESGRVVVRSLREAGIAASVMIALLLLALWRSPRDAALVALPLGLAVFLTAAGSIPLGIPFNFANVIVIPLLLGMGVDTGIHLVHRLRLGAPADGNLLRTSTARAVLLSALTTAASFSTLGFSTHLGLASLGRLLALGIAVMLGANLLVLPALARFVASKPAEQPGSGP